MSNLIFTDQRSFMSYFGQRPGIDTARLYRDLIDEEYGELQRAAHLLDRDAGSLEDVVAVADACLDLIYVAAGLMHALGLDPQPLWDEVHRSNVAKIRHVCDQCAGDGSPCERCGATGVVYEVRRREDGKVLKPEGWRPPELAPLVQAMLTRSDAA